MRPKVRLALIEIVAALAFAGVFVYAVFPVVRRAIASFIEWLF